MPRLAEYRWLRGFCTASASFSTAMSGDGRSGFPNPRSTTSSPARRASIFSESITPKTYGGRPLMRRNSIAGTVSVCLPLAGSVSHPMAGVAEPQSSSRAIPWTRIDAVCIDVGGVVYLPDHARMLAALARLGVAAEPEALDRAHYAGVAATDDFTSDHS